MKIFILMAVSLFFPLVLRLSYFPFFLSKKYTVTQSYIERADILDQEGVILATTIPTQSVYIIPYEILNLEECIKALQPILNMEYDVLKERFLLKSKKFIWIVRHISPKTAKEVAKLGLNGVYVAKDIRRFYPQGALFSHIIGNVDDVGEGITGVEKVFNERLKKNKEPLKLSLLSSVQYVLKNVLDNGRKKYAAKGVSGMIVCAKTGKVLAMYSQTQDFEMNPHHKYEDGNLNLNTQLSFELGSIMKLFSFAMFLDAKKTRVDSVFFAPKEMRIGKYRITDVLRKTDVYLSFEEAFKKSSNIVIGRLILENEKESIEIQQNMFKRCGFLDDMDIDGLQVVPCLLPKKWSLTTAVTAAYGYGIAINSAYYMQAALRLVTGKKKFLKLLQDSKDVEEETIFSKETVESVRYLLASTAKKYNLNKIKLGGKTGTAMKLINNSYHRQKNYCSYFFVIPYDDPKIIGLVVIDEPCANEFGLVLAGYNAAVLGVEIVKQISPILQHFVN